jgi:hypothetical protein
MSAQNLEAELAAVRRLRAIAKSKRMRRSRADKCRRDIENMKSLGASDEDISVWLQKTKGVRLHRSNICRARKKWREQGCV